MKPLLRIKAFHDVIEVDEGEEMTGVMYTTRNTGVDQRLE